MTYRIEELSEKQAAVLRSALELYVRTHLGQIPTIVENLPLKRGVEQHKVIQALRAALHGEMRQDVDGWRSNLGLLNDEADESARIAWDMHTVIRHRLAWDRARAEGRTNPDGSRNFSQMMGVDYDEPSRTAKDERLPVIGRVEQ